MKKRLGFTIIEVSLFLAISALLFVGIAAGTGVNVARQRYNNAVQDYAEFLRRLYSQTEDTQNNLGGNPGARISGCTLASSTVAQTNKTNKDDKHGYKIGDQNANTRQDESGRTNCAIYGKIAVFDAKVTDKNDNPTDEIMVYDVIGDIIDHEHKLPKSADTTLKALLAVHAGFLAYESTSDTNIECKVTYAGGADFHTPDWSSYIETTSDRNERWSGAVMIVRSPIDGSIHTYTLDLNNVAFRIADPVKANTIAPGSCGSVPVSQVKSMHAYLSEYLDESSNSVPHFTNKDTTNFCVNSPDSYAYNGRRRNVRLKPDGTDSSAVELIEMDSGDNACD